MIVWKKTDSSAIRWHGKEIVAVRTDNKVVWELFLSCFGRGFWIDELPWVDTDVWSD